MRKNVEKWFTYGTSARLEDQVKYFIASTVEGYLNGIYDAGYAAMTAAEWIEYVYNAIQYESDIIVNGNERKHLKFYGRENINKLTLEYITNYGNVFPYVI